MRVFRGRQLDVSHFTKAKNLHRWTEEVDAGRDVHVRVAPLVETVDEGVENANQRDEWVHLTGMSVT